MEEQQELQPSAQDKAQTAIAKRGRKNTSIDFVGSINHDRVKALMTSFLNDKSNADRLVKLAEYQYSKVPKLNECTHRSIIRCFLEASYLNIEPNTTLGHAYTIPYYNGKTKSMEAQFIVGYRGLIELAMQSGKIRNIFADIVYEGDVFEVVRGSENCLRHKPNYRRADDAKKVCVYAVANYLDGGFDFEVLTMKEVEQVKQSSKSKDSGPWKSFEEEMIKKTAIRRLAKRLPLTRAAKASIKDEARDDERIEPHVEFHDEEDRVIDSVIGEIE